MATSALKACWGDLREKLLTQTSNSPIAIATLCGIAAHVGIMSKAVAEISSQRDLPGDERDARLRAIVDAIPHNTQIPIEVINLAADKLRRIEASLKRPNTGEST